MVLLPTILNAMVGVPETLEAIVPTINKFLLAPCAIIGEITMPLKVMLSLATVPLPKFTSPPSNIPLLFKSSINLKP